MPTIFQEREAEKGKYDVPLPAWAATLQRRIKRGAASVFIITGPGVRDIHPGSARRFVAMRDFLAEMLFADRSAVILYDRGAGIKFTDRQVEDDFKMILKAYDKANGTNLAASLPRDPDRALQLIESYVRNNLADNPRFTCTIVVDYADSIAPAGEPGQLPVEDRASIVTLRRWAADPQFLRRGVVTCVIADAAASLNASITSDARTMQIEVPVPDEAERYAFLTGRGATPDTWKHIDPRHAAVLTSGLTRLNLERIMADAEGGGTSLDADALTREKKRMIEQASGGLLQFMTSAVGLDAVAGHEGAKALLRETARALQGGRLDVIPMGFLICGPVGTGKSFIVQCFAAEIGVPVVALKNFRSKWQGQTEANLERILAILDGIGPTAVVIDEADAALGTRDSDGADSGVSERVFAALANFMGDTRRRGRVLWFLMTSRPDLVPVDLKRQGRAEEHIALFPPQTAEERAGVFERLRARLKIPAVSGLDVTALFGAVGQSMSAADIESVLVRASRRMAAGGHEKLTAELLGNLIKDFQPPAYPLEIEYQKLIAAMECTSRDLLPKELAEMSPEDMSRQLSGIRAALGR